MACNDESEFIDVQKERRKLEQEVDDIIWDHGVHDPRLEQLFNQLKHYKKLEERGELYEPKF